MLEGASVPSQSIQKSFLEEMEFQELDEGRLVV